MNNNTVDPLDSELDSLDYDDEREDFDALLASNEDELADDPCNDDGFGD